MVRVLCIFILSGCLIFSLTGCGKKSCSGPTCTSKDCDTPECKSKKDSPPGFNPTWHDTSDSKPNPGSTDNSSSIVDSLLTSGVNQNVSTYSGSMNPVMGLNIQNADQIDDQKAQILLTGMGLMGPNSYHKLSYSKALAAACQGVSYKSSGRRYTGPTGGGCNGVKLTDRVKPATGNNRSMKEWLFDEYKLLKSALSKFSKYPTISITKTPGLFQEWVKKAAPELTQVTPASKREKVLLSLMTTESGKTHWRNFTPVASQAGAYGFGQFLSRTAVYQYKINHYDPEQNVKGIASMINDVMKSKGYDLRKALMYYHGGSTMGSASKAYADGILARI